MLRELLNLFKVTGGGRLFLYLLLLRCPFDALRSILQAYFLQYSFYAISDKSYNNLYFVCGIFAIGSLLLFLYNGVIWMRYAAYIIGLESNLRKKSFEHVSRLSLIQIDSKSSGEWFARLNTDVQMNILSKPLHIPHGIVALLNICVSGVILLRMKPWIFILVILFLIPHILISQLYIAKPMSMFATKLQEATGKNTTDINALITCADTAVLYDGWNFLLKQFEDSSLNIRKLNMYIKKRSSLGDAILPMMGMGGYLTLLLIAGTQISRGTLTFAELTAAFQYRGGIITGALMFSNSLISIKSALAGVKRLNETLNMKLEE